jgi:hypothetical protein
MNFTHSLTTTVAWDEDLGCWVAWTGTYPNVQGEGEDRFEALADLEEKILELERVEKGKTKPG